MRWVVITGGPNFHYDALREEVDAADRIICADSGAFHAKEMGMLPYKLIGDLDSIDNDTLSWIHELRVPLEVFPVEKDTTDSELCMREIPSTNPILLICSLSGRPDHVLSNLLLAGQLTREGYHLTLTDGLTWVYPLMGPASFRLDFQRWKTRRERDGLAISLLPIFSEVTGVTTVGLYYPLSGQTLQPGSSFSVSNRAQKSAPEIGIDFAGGVLLVMVTPAE